MLDLLKKIKKSEVTLNTNLYYIVEKFSYENKIHALYADSYKECVGGLEFYEHRSHTKIEEMPPIFSEMYTFPEELLTEDEKNEIIENCLQNHISSK